MCIINDLKYVKYKSLSLIREGERENYNKRFVIDRTKTVNMFKCNIHLFQIDLVAKVNR